MRTQTTVITGLLCTIIVLVISCSKASEDELAKQNANPSICDTTNSKYAADVVPILQANCYSCHGNGEEDGGVKLDTYTNVKDEAEDGSLLGTITHTSGYPAMPLDGNQLSECDINTIRSWINNGMLNN